MTKMIPQTERAKIKLLAIAGSFSFLGTVAKNPDILLGVLLLSVGIFLVQIADIQISRIRPNIT